MKTQLISSLASENSHNGMLLKIVQQLGNPECKQWDRERLPEIVVLKHYNYHNIPKKFIMSLN